MSAWRRWGAGVVIAVPLGLGVATLAEAGERPGGGSSFSGGSRSGGGGGFSGGGGSSWSGGGGSSSYSGGGGDLGPGGLLISVLGLGIVIAINIAKQAAGDNDGWSSASDDIDYGAVFATPPQPFAPLRPRPVSLAPLREHDPSFSQILLEDFLYELYARAHEARASADDLAQLAPYLDAKARNALTTRGNRKVLAVGGVIVGSMRVAKLERKDGWDAIEVEYETNYTEVYSGGGGGGEGRLGYYARERWHFVRRQGVASRKPDETRGFNCASCGAPVEHSERDACSYCGAKHGTGEFDWSCNGIALEREETRGPALTGYAPEVGTFDATVLDARLDPQLASLQALDPEFDLTRFRARVELIYHELNEAWSSLRWQDARPFLSDRLWLSMRYWIHAYEQQGLRNEMLDARVDRQQIAKVEHDPFFHAITVRVWATAIDKTVHRQTGAVVGGNPHEPRHYSEYWTFIRSAERRGASSVDKQCPSCGAELRIGMAGNCELCGVKVTAGQFDWVLSKIEQDEAYVG